MHQSNRAHDTLVFIGKISSKKDKEEALKVVFSGENECLRKAVLMACDPFVTFGMKAMPKVKFGTEEFNDNTWDMLARLQNRELTGKPAKLALEYELGRLSMESADLLKYIITGKVIPTGFTANTINKVSPGAIFVFKMCLADKFNDHCDKITDEMWIEGVPGEIKADGVRGVSLQAKEFHFVSRNGLPLNSNQSIRDEVRSFLSEWSIYFWGYSDLGNDFDGLMVLDCELVEANDDFNDSVGSVRSKDESRSNTVQVKVIDVLTQDEMDSKKSVLPYVRRREMLEEFFDKFSDQFPNIHLIQGFTFHSEREARNKFDEVKAAGEEGLIIKLPNGHWEQKRSKSWLKMKACETVDLTIKSVEAGDPNGNLSDTMGKVVCDYVNSKGETVEVKIGGGFSMVQRAEVWAAHTGEDQVCVTTTKGEVSEVVVKASDCDSWVGTVIEVAFHEETKYGSLREPRFKVRRFDKDPKDGQGK